MVVSLKAPFGRGGETSISCGYVCVCVGGYVHMCAFVRMCFCFVFLVRSGRVSCVGEELVWGRGRGGGGCGSGLVWSCRAVGKTPTYSLSFSSYS